MTKSDAVFQAAQRAHEEPPEDGTDFLADKPKGFCPWDGKKLINEAWRPFCPCGNWDTSESEDDNRALYAAEQEVEAAHEDRLARDAKRHRGGEW